MANYRNVATQIWRDKDFVAASKEGKLIFLYLITNAGARESGIYFILPSDIAASGAATEAQVAERLAGGQGKDAGLFRNVFYDFDRGAVFVVNYRLYQKAAGGRPDLLAKAIATDRAEVRTKLWVLYDYLYDEYGQAKPEGFIPEDMSQEIRAKGGPTPRRRVKAAPSKELIPGPAQDDVSRETLATAPAEMLKQAEDVIAILERYKMWPRDEGTRERERVLILELAATYPDVDLFDAATALRIWLDGRGKPPKNHLLQLRNWIKGSHDKGINLKPTGKAPVKRGFMPELEDM